MDNHKTNTTDTFDYHEAFSRTLGWITEDELEVLRSKKIAIAGVGGVGGVHLLTLTRLGIGKFNISDFDTFEQGNFNRQAGAYLQNIGRPKIDVMAEMALGINPELEITKFSDGVTLDNIDEFLSDVDVYIDGLDFFVLDLRRAVFQACYDKGIPALTAAPLGMGVAFLAFQPGQMSFEQYFRMENCDADEKSLRFLVGLSPAMLQLGYLADQSRVDLENQKGPSTPMACEMCAGVAATNTLKLLLNRGKVKAAPWGLHFDAYKNQFKTTWRPWGNSNPVQKLMLKIARKSLMSQREQQREAKAGDVAPDMKKTASDIEQVLEWARWAPSGDNTQVWDFELLSDTSVRIHGYDTRDWCVYDLRGRASQIAQGALLQTLEIAANKQSFLVDWQLIEQSDESKTLIDVNLTKTQTAPAAPLLPYIKTRSVQRRLLKRNQITDRVKTQLEQIVGDDYSLIWVDGNSRWDMAKLLFRSAKLRLTIKEAYDVHSKVIEWDSQYSEDRIPDQAVGMDPVGLKLMRWALKSWKRVQFLNRYLAGTWLPRIQLDLMPGLYCGAHFILTAKKTPENTEDYLNAGRAVQRLWLEAARLGLQFQPEMTPLIFSQYSESGQRFTSDENGALQADEIRQRLKTFFGDCDLHSGVFMGRLGYGPAPVARSLRKPLEDLLIKSKEGA
ncbi:ThiF family adenylyltransferase [Aestuariicella sp. G3-2]|uniref:ThiF family adenylyltransferase n=1 Tax=Pseudomaricurvus albidus TaxID=2842452 RepID=UPI001C0C443E|nr:ThiF family adenylyltransferase [Aestuariicella albida]MBU3070853.1 ThiF family adenylyltransferase [Aestuariicella albida]